MEKKEYDLLIIGGGPSGYEAAFRASELGLKTALVEKEQPGGTCLNHGCIPTKTLLHAAKRYRDAKEFSEIGLCAERLQYDSKKMHEHKAEVINSLKNGILFLLKTKKIDYWNGVATVIGRQQVEVQWGEEGESRGEKQLFHARNILLATGAKPVLPSITGISLPKVYTSEQLLEAELHPQRVLILGGGVIGVEFAMLLNALDCEVTMIEAEKRILPSFDREISQKLSMHLKKRGIIIRQGIKVEKIQEGKKDGKEHLLVYTSDGIVTEIEMVLISVGRRPNIEGLFSESFMKDEVNALQAENGRLLVDENYQTAIAGIYAAGDVIGGIQLAHVAAAEGISAVEAIAKTARSMKMQTVPSCVYSDPEIASVGLTEEAAKAQGMSVKTRKYSMAANGKALIEGQQMGFIKVVYLEETEAIVGAQLFCQRATDLISELATAVANELTVQQLASVIRPHPTFCEGIGLALR